MKTLFKNSIDKKSSILEIDKIIENPEKSNKLFSFLKNIKEMDEKSGKANFFKKKEEKISFVEEIKKLDNYEEIAKDKDLLQKMIHNNYLELLLPYVIENSIDTYESIEILGIGFYENNQDIFEQ